MCCKLTLLSFCKRGKLLYSARTHAEKNPFPKDAPSPAGAAVPGRTGCSGPSPATPAAPAEGSGRTTATGRRRETPSVSRTPQVGRGAHFPPLLRPASPPPPTCAGAGRREGHRPALPPPTGPEELPEAPREAAALRPRNAMAAHGVALCPQSRRPAANGPPNAKSSIPHVRTSDGPGNPEGRLLTRRRPRTVTLAPPPWSPPARIGRRTCAEYAVRRQPSPGSRAFPVRGAITPRRRPLAATTRKRPAARGASPSQSLAPRTTERKDWGEPRAKDKAWKPRLNLSFSWASFSRPKHCFLCGK